MLIIDTYLGFNLYLIIFLNINLIFNNFMKYYDINDINTYLIQFFKIGISTK